MSPAPKDHRAEVDALAAELAGLEALNARHEAAADEAARKHRAGKATPDELQAATSAAAAVEYALDQTRADLEAARVALAEMESAAADERLLAEIAAGTLAYREAEAANWTLHEETQQAIARAILRSQELTKAAGAAKARAGKAAHALAERHDKAPEPNAKPVPAYQRAVSGTDVRPLTGDDQVLRWPAGHAFKLLRGLPTSLLGVTITDAEAEAGA